VDWILRIKSDENKALSELYQYYKKEAVLWVQSEFHCTPEESMDVFQTGIIILYDNIISGKLSALTSDIKTYLFGIIRNKALEVVRYNQKQHQMTHGEAWVHYVQSETHETYPEGKLNAAVHALEKLGNPCKSLLEQYYYHDQSMEEIARALGYKNADSAKNQKYKCLKRLQSLFSEHIVKMTEFEE
jgi:RNA polymerase sigma factor (sigma-70 family)